MALNEILLEKLLTSGSSCEDLEQALSVARSSPMSRSPANGHKFFCLVHLCPICLWLKGSDISSWHCVLTDSFGLLVTAPKASEMVISGYERMINQF